MIANSAWLNPQSNPRGIATLAVVVLTLATLALSPIPLRVLVPVTAATMLFLAVGSAAPALIHLYVRSLRYRPEPRQWRWGVVISSVAVCALAVFYGPANQVLAVGAVCTHGLYAAGKFGCTKFGCCQAVPYRVVNATVSLPAFETALASAVFVCCVVLSILGEYKMAVAAGFACHCAARAISYWARGTNVDPRHPLRTPDVFVLVMPLVVAAGT